MEDNKIPRIIHFCWFGKGKKTKLERKCIKSWEKYAPSFEIIEWNEDNFDVQNNVPFVFEAYLLKKYGFIADYLRLWALYNYGGIYLDTDIELIDDIDSILDDNSCFFGFENNEYIASAILGSSKGNPVIKKLLDYYLKLHFDENKMHSMTSPKIWTPLLCEYGIVPNGIFQKNDYLTVYPSDYFFPKQPFITKEGFVRWKTTITNNTICIHHFLGSWLPKKTLLKKMKSFIYLVKCKLGINKK